MALFKKKTKEVKKDSSMQQPTMAGLPRLPELPKLPEFNESYNLPKLKTTPRLPQYPSTSLGEKFSQDTIKEAVSGKKVVEMDEDENDFENEDMQRIHQPISRPMQREYREQKIKEEPVFVRLDKFEDSLHIFEKAKNQIKEITDVLDGIKKIKEDEDKELQHWENEIQAIKGSIERIDRDIFSKLE